MTPEQLDRLEESLHVVEPVMASLVADFYHRLFAAEPAARSSFPPDMSGQHDKLAAMLETIVASVRDHDRFVRRCAALGERHAGYGAAHEHYAAAGEALLAAFAAALGDRWDEETAQAWAAAYDLVAEVMRTAQRGASPVL